MKWSESIKRPDWLKELQAVLIISLVVIGGLAIVGAAAAGGGDSLQLELPATGVSGTVTSGLHAGATIATQQDVTVTVADPSPGQRVASVLTGLPTYLVIAALLTLLLRIVRRARSDEAFTLATARRLQVLAVVTLAGGYLGFLVELFAAMQLSSTVLTDGTVGFAEVPMHWFLIGFGLFAVAEVVKRGSAMRAELDTVI